MKTPIAVVGTACRFPGDVASPSQLWELLSNPKDVLKDLDPKRLNLSSFYHHDGEHHGATGVPNKSYILEDDVYCFDAAFFNISAAEAEAMDPQQRLLLETTYEALEAAGYTLKQLRGSNTSVFIGAMTSDYHDIQARDLDTISRWHATGTSPSILSNRVSYFFDLRGPSMTINTACSSSLVALHQAVNSLRNGDCTIAIVGGVNLLLDPEVYISHSNLHMLSPTSRCRMWDKDADGYARGEGCASVVIKTLDQALQDGDDIECIIRETAVNSDGRSAGITMPNPEAQATLIRQTYEHSAGDPVEAQAIQQTFYPQTVVFSPNDKLYVGSIKTLIGHLEGCAGLAGVMKAIMCLKNQIITPNMLFDDLNPNITPFYDHLEVPTRTLPWPPVAPGCPLRVSVNSFGFGGTNAHAIIESYVPRQSKSQVSCCKEPAVKKYVSAGPFVFSAHTQDSLHSHIEQIARYVRKNEALGLGDLAWSLAKRTVLPFKASMTALDRGEFLCKIDTLSQEYKDDKRGEQSHLQWRHSPEPEKIMAIFTGQGAQWAGMGRQLLCASPIFRQSIEQCERALARLPDGPCWSLHEELLADEASSSISNPAVSQPVTTAIEIAVYDLLCACGINVDAVVGHSSGEIVAAYALGIISAEDSMKIAYYRGMHSKPVKLGGMLAVGLSFHEASELCSQPALSGRIVVGASNGPVSTTLSGDYDAILEAKALLDHKKIFARTLQVDVAYHSHHMVPCATTYLESLTACNIQVGTPRSGCTWISSVTGSSAITKGDIQAFSATYWVENMVKPVLFSQAVERSHSGCHNIGACIEIGPHPALRGPVLDTLRSKGSSNVLYTSLLHRGHNDLKAASCAVGYLWERMPERVDIGRFLQSLSNQPLQLMKGLPAYTWDHTRRYWRESRVSRTYRLEGTQLHPLLGRRSATKFPNEMSWRNILHLKEMPWAQGHRKKGQVVLSTAFYLSSLLAAASSAAMCQCLVLVEVENLVTMECLTLQEHGDGIEYITTLRIRAEHSETPSDAKLDAEGSCHASLSDGSVLTKLCTARLTLHVRQANRPNCDQLPPREQQNPLLTPINVADLYDSFEQVGTDYSGPFRSIISIQRSLGRATACAAWPADTTFLGSLLHPAIPETSFQTITCAFASPWSKALCTSFHAKEIRRALVQPYFALKSPSCLIDAFVTTVDNCGVKGDVSLYDPDGNAMIQIEGLVMESAPQPHVSAGRSLYSHMVWESDPFGYSLTSSYNTQDEMMAWRNAADIVVWYHFRRLVDEIDPLESAGLLPHHQLLYREISRIADDGKGSENYLPQPDDGPMSEESLLAMIDGYAGVVDLHSLHSLGMALPAILRGENDPFDISNGGSILERLSHASGMFSALKTDLCCIVKRIGHKHPHMDVLELHVGTGVITQQILEALDDKYSSYGLSSATPISLEQTVARLSTQHRNLYSKVVDLTTAEDGEHGSDKYDMVIAANPFHATDASASLLETCRAILKPGGYLVFVRLSGRMPMSLLCVCGLLPRWWQGYNHDAQTWSDMSTVKCNAQLRSKGFSGIDHIFHGSTHPNEDGLSVIVTQAVNDTVLMLREPMNSTGLAPLTETVALIGGKTLLVARLLQSIQRILAASGSTTTAIVENIGQLDLDDFTNKYAIISLLELDEPFFAQGIFHERVLNFKKLVARSKHVLWLTSSQMPSITVALGRAMRLEKGNNTNLQFLQLSSMENISPATVVEIFLRLTWSSVPMLTDGQMLWTNESELQWDGCALRIPRLVWDPRRNQRYNSRHQETHPKACLSQTSVILPREMLETSVAVQVKYSCLICTDAYLWFGTRVDGRGNAIGISDHISSVVQARPEHVHSPVDEDGLSPDTLRVTASLILAYLLLKSRHGPILLYEPDNLLAVAVEQARGPEHTIYCITSKCNHIVNGWIAVHPYASRRMVERLLPREVSAFVDFSASDNHVVTVLRKIYSQTQIQPAELYRRVFLESPGQLIADTYIRACTSLSTLPLAVTPSAEASPNNPLVTYPKLVDWTGSPPIPSHGEMLRTANLFSPSGTYWMIDMATPLGLSILTWMASNGARTFVLSSWNPHVHEAWLEEMSRLGATVKPLKMDPLNKKSILSAFTQIKQTLPPIVGVCYAPVAISDKGFAFTAHDEGGLVTNATINAAKYLDELFPTPTLNFFVILTSLVSVLGTPKQVAYHASAQFMTGLIHQRRWKGLAGSVLALGMVVDAEYFVKQGREVIQRMMHHGYAPLSESDVHHAFGEAVAAGPPEAEGNPEIFFGLQMIDSHIDRSGELSCRSSHLLSHFTTKDFEAKPGQDTEQVDSSSLRLPSQESEKLEPRRSTYDTLLARFSNRVKSILRLPDQTLDLHAPLLDLGCDSLLAVDLQIWMVKEFDIEMTPMGVLLDTVAGLCEKAVCRPGTPGPVPQEEDLPAKESDNVDLMTTASSSEHNSSVQDLPLDTSNSESSCVLCPSDSGFEREQDVFESRFTRLEKMSPHQSQIWFAGHWMKDPTQYNVVISYKAQGSFLVDKFKGALDKAVSRHESLRTAFFSDPNNGDLVQGVLKTQPPFFEHVMAVSAASVAQEFDRLASYQWRLDLGEVIRVAVVSIGQDQHTVIFGYHHIVMDGASWSTFLHDLRRFYEQSPPHEVAQYVDYSLMLNRDIDNGAFAKELEYWKSELSPPPEVIPVLPVAKEKTRTATNNFKIHKVTRYVSVGVADRIKKASRSLRGTPFHFYLATLQVLLAGLLKIENLCIGMSDANRKHQQFIGTVGYFLNMLPLRFHVQQTDSFANIFQKTSSKVLTALSHSSIPSNLVVDALNLPRVLSVTPLFQVAINYRVGEITRMSVDDFDLNYDRSVMGNAPYDVSFHVTPCVNGTSIVEVNCRDYLYSPEATESIMDEYIRLLDLMSSDPSLSVRSSLAPSSSVNEDGLSIQRGPRMSHGWPSTLPERFQDITDRYGDKVAVSDPSGDFSYLQLYAQSTHIGEALLHRGIRSGDTVAVLCHPSINSVASMLAVLRIGAVYVPLDLSLPTARHKAMILASPVTGLVCLSSTAGKASELEVSTVINISEIPDIQTPSIPFTSGSKGDCLSILLYTSGSTGQPKGVRLPQRGFINYLAAKRKALGLDSSTVVLQQSSLGFDMGLAQTLNAVMNGGRLVIVPQEVRGDSIEIARIIRDHKVTFTLATPSEYLVMLQHGREYLSHHAGWRHACLGGEPFTDQLKREFARLGKNCPMVQDSYGVTEISACTTFETMSASQLEGARSVGRTIPNTSLYIVDAECNLVAIGEPGEICISGTGVALGYLNEEQTRLKFVEDPFALPADVARGWTRMYRTGDKAKLLKDGSLVLLGRMDGDTEIKLRGLRIDLEDVASTMLNCHPNLLSSAIVCVKDQGVSEILVAFVALMPGQTATDVELQYLASNLPLPQYMRPSTVICLDELPRNSNGKIDRKKIDGMPWVAPATTGQPSKRLTLGEGELKLLWQVLLPGKHIQPESDFFLLGGNSTLLVRLQGAIRTSIGISLTLRELYGACTLAQMALKVDARKADAPSMSINWLAETSIPQNILDCAPSTPKGLLPKRHKRSGWQILLTGSTSFLGRVLVQVLLQVHKVDRVHCIAVEKEQEHVLPSSEKVSLYYGTLLDPMLGLSTPEWASLQCCIDVVIHGGSNGHCLNTYNSLKAPNLGSTHRLAQFALQSHIPLHYISSGRVILQSGQTSLGPTSLSFHPPPLDGSDGLTATKWASEVFLERFAAQTGVSISIHRPCTPIGDQAPAQDALNSLLRYSVILGATPRLTRMEGYLDFQKVEIIADEISTLVMSRLTTHSNAPSSRTSEVCFFHHSSNIQVPVKNFKEYMEKVHSRPFQEMSLQEWSSLALDQGIEPLIPSFLEAVDDNEETLRYPYLGQ
ncbi:polyketide synthase-nonribosomal peptide synthetase hybrid [Aspergillus bombycis]|uniref:Polyketide synthase-nonribosomal peptide synthetase hybrid n=1 Tax=Aspergillus bombycis TaxID=109264 RepID=A0A1F8ADD8_9EURO|nr:polyketide synthase-nonribosomal peptide synthetase hybrid [Aspergillus bombycis]OGM49764.1 polyketide synthase-nonribosomal peptide synthetase hybrid [Aspergillus bombycis]